MGSDLVVVEAEDGFSAIGGARVSKLVSEVVLGEADRSTIHLVDCIDGCGLVVPGYQEVDPVSERSCSFHGAEQVDVRGSPLCSFVILFGIFLVFKHEGKVFGHHQA